MRSFSTALKNHLATGSTTLCTCWEITRQDTVVDRYTDHDQNLTISGNVYSSVNAPYSSAAFGGRSDMSVDNTEMDIVFGTVSRDDIRAGAYDYAEIKFYLVNWASPDLTGKMLRAWTGEVSCSDEKIHAELRGMTQLLHQHVGKVYSPTCRFDLGDSLCAVDLEALAVTSAVESPIWDTDFSEYTTGAQPAGTTERFDTAGAFTVQAGGSMGGKYLYGNSTGTTDLTEKLLSFDDLDGTVNFDALVLVRPKTEQYRIPLVFGRASGTASPVYYAAGLSAVTDALFISKRVGGVYTEFTPVSVTVTAGSWYWLRFRVIGNALKAKVWAYGVGEPGAWNKEVTDSDISAGGWVGIGDRSQSYFGRTRDFDCDYLAVSRDGTVVPVPGTAAAYKDRFKDFSRTEADGYFDYGKVVFTSGANSGREMEILTYDGTSKEFILFEPLPDEIAEGDGVTLYPGCDKAFSTCQTKFSNNLRFGGEPDLPGEDALKQYPDRSPYE